SLSSPLWNCLSPRSRSSAVEWRHLFAAPRLAQPTYITPRKMDVALTPVPRPGMSCLSGTTLSLLASAPPPTSAVTNILLGALVFTTVAYIVYYASPTRLMHILVASIAATERTYFEAIEAGVLPKSDADTAATLTSLQIKVSNIHEMTLRHSLSYRTTLGAFLTGHSFTVLDCIRDICRLEAHPPFRIFFRRVAHRYIVSPQILKEARLRASDPASKSAMRMVSVRRCHKNNAG
ncbi:hypothetical protein FB451DRAFT_1486958, partial [Mycena latifolia]